MMFSLRTLKNTKGAYLWLFFLLILSFGCSRQRNEPREIVSLDQYIHIDDSVLSLKYGNIVQTTLGLRNVSEPRVLFNCTHNSNPSTGITFSFHTPTFYDERIGIIPTMLVPLTVNSTSYSPGEHICQAEYWSGERLIDTTSLKIIVQ